MHLFHLSTVLYHRRTHRRYHRLTHRRYHQRHHPRSTPALPAIPPSIYKAIPPSIYTVDSNSSYETLAVALKNEEDVVIANLYADNHKDLAENVHVRYKIFLSSIEYLPFSPGVDSDGSIKKGSFEEIIGRVLSRSREVKAEKYDGSSDVAEQCRLQSLQKAMVVQWLCFTPPTTITDAMRVGTKLLLWALMHSNVLFRKFAIISMWRIPALPSGAHTLLSLLAEPLKHPSETLLTEDPDTSDSLREFED